MKALKHFFIHNYWLIIGIFISLILVLVWFSSLDENQFLVMFSSDALYLPLIYQDIFENGNSIQGWTFNGAPNFVPDMLVFFILMKITSNFLTATFLFSIIQYFSIITLFYFIYRKISTISPAFFTFSIYLFSIFLLYFLVNKEFYYSFLLMSNSYHNGMFVMALITILLTINFFKNESWVTLVAIFFVSVIAVPCDRLFVFAYSAPLLCILPVLLNAGYKKKNIFKLGIVCILAVLLGFLIFDKLSHNSIIDITRLNRPATFEAMIDSWKMFSSQIIMFLSHATLLNLATVLSILTLIWTVYYCVAEFVCIKRKKKEISVFFIFQLFVTFSTLSIMLAPIVNGNYFGYDVIRYNYFFYIILLFNLVLLANHCIRKQKYLVFGLNAFFSLGLTIYLIWNIMNMDFGQQLKNYFSFYPEHARNLDALFDDDEETCYGFTNDFWFGKHAAMFTRKNIRLYTGFDSGSPWLHATNENWFFGGGNWKYSNPRFTFLVWRNDVKLPDFFVEQNPPYQSFEIDGVRTLYRVQPFVYERGSFQPKLLVEN